MILPRRFEFLTIANGLPQQRPPLAPVRKSAGTTTRRTRRPTAPPPRHPPPTRSPPRKAPSSLPTLARRPSLPTRTRPRSSATVTSARRLTATPATTWSAAPPARRPVAPRRRRRTRPQTTATRTGSDWMKSLPTVNTISLVADYPFFQLCFLVMRSVLYLQCVFPFTSLLTGCSRYMSFTRAS